MTIKDIEYAKKVIAEKFPLILKKDVKKIIMYGSCARKDYGENSDIDIAVLTDCDRVAAKDYDDKLMDVVTDIAMDSDAIVEYVCIPYNEFEAKKSWYLYFKNINAEGEVLYG